MTYLDLALTAATVLLFLFGLRALMSKDGHQSLGCGFGVAAALLLSWMFRDEVGGYFNGLRLGLGLLLLLPAVKSLLQPQGKSIVFAAGALILAFLVAGEPVRRVYVHFNPGAQPRGEVSLEARLVESEDALAQISGLRDLLRTKEVQLEEEIRALGDSKAQVLSAPGGEEKLKQYLKVREKLEELDSNEALLRANIEATRLELEQLRLAGEASAASAENPAWRAALTEIESAGSEPSGGTIEELMERAELEQVLEERLGFKE